jgi:hypothetical protein
MLLAKVTGGMYGHPQAGLFAYKELRAHLALHGFTSQETTPCVFANANYSVVFTPVVDDFLPHQSEIANRVEVYPRRSKIEI